MTIKKRLFLSNLMMIVVPVVIVTVVGLGCMGLVLSVVKSGTNFGLDSDSEFYWASQGAVELAEHYIKDNSPQKKATLEDVLNTGVMAIEIQENGNSIYTYGKTMADDKNIIKSAQLLNSDGIVVTSQGRGVFRKTETYNGRNYDIYVMGTQHITTSKSLKMVGVFSLLAIILSVVVAILITNRILTKYVFKKVENPLNLLVYGVNEIGKGNLDYSVTYTENDEFKTVFEAFNEMTKRLKDSVEQTKKNEESRKELMAGISHDIRSPLTSIKAYVEGLLDGIAKTEEIRLNYLRIIKKKAEDIERLVSQIFTFSKLDLDEYPMKIETVALDKEIENIVENYSEEYREKGLEISVGNLNKCVAEIDREQFLRVMLNITDNSLKYKNKEVGHLCIELEKNENSCTIKMADDGIGVTQSSLHKLFDVFYRTDNARENPSGGSGLGLAITAKIIERLNGSIRAENGENGGLTIIITLPRKGVCL